MRWKKTKLSLIFIILTVCTLFVQTPLMNLKNNALVKNYTTNLRNSGSSEVTNTKQWIKNGNFTSDQYWYPTKELLLGDPNDVAAEIDTTGEQANFTVIGETGRKEISDPINIANSGNWKAFNKTEPAINPDGFIIDDNGFYVNHSWHDATADQFASIYWRYNVSMDVDMSEYEITSAFLNATMYADVDRNVDAPNDAWARYGGDDFSHSDDQPINQPGIFDHAFFIVEISDLNVSTTYRIAYNQTTNLGQYDQGPVEYGYPTILTIEEKSIEQVGDESDLVYYLNKVFESDPGHDNFTIIIGIEISCEDDNTGSDYDDWDELRVKFLNLTFTYEKKIDKQSSISWNQDGDKPDDISTNPITVTEALLDFKFKIGRLWPTYLSQNSEIRIYINGNQFPETIKLSSATKSFQKAKIGGFDLTYLIEEDQNINLSIQVYIADDFNFDRNISISIDEVYLNVTYIETVTNIQTDLKLFLNGKDKTSEKFIEVPLAEELNITVKYTNLTGDYIPSALVQLEGKVNGTLDPFPIQEQYTIIVNTSDLGIGAKLLTVTAEKLLYDNQEINFFVEVIERETELLLFLNDSPKLDGETIQIELNETLEVKVEFRDNVSMPTTLIKNATIELVGVGELNETDGIYNIFLNASDLGQGISAFNIFAQKINYETQSIKFYVEVFERKTDLLLFLNDNSTNDGETIQVKIDDIINVTVYYQDDFSKQNLTGATVNLVGFGKFNETNDYYNYTIHAADLGQGFTVFTIFAELDNYQSQSIQFIAELIEIQTTILLKLDDTPTSNGEKIQVDIRDSVNVTIYYRDDIGQHISGATVNLVGIGKFNETNNQYNYTINAADLSPGITVFTVYAQLDNYQSRTIQFQVELADVQTTISLLLNGTPTSNGEKIQIDIRDSVNVTIYYKDDLGQYISGATVNLIGVGKFNETNNYYNYTINAADLSPGITVFTVYAQLDNYQSRTIQFQVELVDVQTTILLLLDDTPTSNGEKIQIDIRDSVNVTIYYKDDLGQYISGATVNLIGVGKFNETNNYYNYTINAADLSPGITVFTVYAQLDNYQSRTIQFQVELVDVQTTISLFLNGNPTSDSEKIQVDIRDSINVTIYYRDDLSQHISGVTVNLIGVGKFNETNNYYNYTINAADLSPGITVFTVYAQLDNYQIQSIQFLVELVDIESNISLFIDGTLTNDGETIQIEIDDSLNITIYYRDDLNQHISGAMVNMVGRGLLNETNDYYNITIDALDLEQGITVLTIYAQLDNYQIQSIQFLVEIVERATELLLFVDSAPIIDGDTIEIEADDILNITVYYRDNETKLHLPGATVDLVGRGLFNETNDYYNITINAANLDQGITILTIFAQLVNYRPQSFQFFVKVVERATNIQLFLNNDDKTLDPTYSLTIGQFLNITIKFTDNQTGNHINTALIQIIGQGFTYNLTRDDILGQYYIILDSEDLGIGVKLFSIVAQANNFQIKSIDPRITVSRISAEIRTSSGDAQIEAEIGDDVLLQIILNDTIFGADIAGALVTYSWAYGPGELEDLDDDGIYEVLLENVREGVHTITISAAAGDDYDFESYTVTLVVTAPTVTPGPNLSWLIYVLTGGIVGLVSVFTLYQTHFKYPPMVRKIRKLKKKVRKAKKTKPILVNKREEIINNELQNQIKSVEYEVLQTEQVDKIEKTSFKEGGEN